ncbi:MAG: thermonuclease family protein [Candidatus Nanohaloarchaea archaeon]
MKARLIFLFSIILTSGCISLSSTQSAEAEVVKVTDGDTVEVLIDGRKETVRFDGIDTPEVHAENKPKAFEGIKNSQEGKNCLRSYGENASSYVKQRIGNSTVRLEYKKGILAETRGDYGRLLAEIFYDNKSLNQELVEKGLARSYTEEGPYFEEEVEAKLDMRGVWKCQRVG